jgi:hypothetical protein
MTTANRWSDLRPVKGGLAGFRIDVDKIWEERLRFDRERLKRNQTPDLAKITAEVEARARRANAQALVLTGSTARGRRTEVSDLDYHVIGKERIDLAILPAEIDLYRDEHWRFKKKLEDGDDFAFWSVWFGCVIFDSGPFREAVEAVAMGDFWPDPDRKIRQADELLGYAEAFVDSGDYPTMLEYSRTALSTVARWLLLSGGIFPLARDELSGQLREIEFDGLAEDLRDTIHGRPSEVELGRALKRTRAVIERPLRAAA